MDRREKMCMECIAFGNLFRRSTMSSRGLKEAEECARKEGWMLIYLQQNTDRDIFQKDIEEAFSLSRSAVSKSITALEKSGLISREAVEHDARLRKLVLTPKAIELNENIRLEMLNSWKKVTADLTEEEMDEFIRILKKIERNF